MPIQVVDRSTGKCFHEKVYGDFWLKLFYENRATRKFLSARFVQRNLSKLYGAYQSSTLSRSQVDNFIHNFSIDMENFEMPLGGYANFNEFFIRRKKNGKISFPEKSTDLGAPCDARLFVAPIQSGRTLLHVKGRDVLVDELCSEDLGAAFEGGHALVFRLCPSDYHRFHFVDSGVCSRAKDFGQKLHSVNPVSLKKVDGVFLENERQTSFLESENFSKVGMVEVGALNVGKIIQCYSPDQKVQRGDEKGYFKFGASTQILLLNKDVSIDEDLLENSQKNLETLVVTGEKIGQRK